MMCGPGTGANARERSRPSVVSEHGSVGDSVCGDEGCGGGPERCGRFPLLNSEDSGEAGREAVARRVAGSHGVLVRQTLAHVGFSA